MKHLLLITVFAMALTTKLLAQEKSAIEVKGLEKQPFKSMKSSPVKDEHQFEIIAHESVDINLNFTMKTEDTVNVTVTDKNDHVVLSKEYHKKGTNKLTFPMSEEEEYHVRLSSSTQSNMTVSLVEN